MIIELNNSLEIKINGKSSRRWRENLIFCCFDYKLTTKNCVKFVVRFNIFTFCSESELQGLERMPSTFSHLKHWPSPSLALAELKPDPMLSVQYSQPGVRPPCCSSLQSLFTLVSTSLKIFHIFHTWHCIKETINGQQRGD